MAEDYYKTLGISREASQAEIDKAYATLARKYHPDLNPDDKSAKKKFQEVQSAYDVLKDPAKREMYDRYGSSFESAAAGARPGPGWGRRAGGDFEEFDFSQFFGERFGAEPGGGFADLFGQFRRGRPGAAGRRARPGAPPQGRDVRYETQIPFNVAVTGGQVDVAVPRATGRVETIAVKIPPGIEDGQKIRLRGQGEPSPNGGPAGDLFITVRVGTHPYYTRRGEHLYVKVPVTLREAAEGAKVDVPTPKGTVSVRIPRGSSSGTRLRIKGHGASAPGREPGDLFAEIQIVLPPDLDDQARQLIGQLDARYPLQPRRDLRW